MVSVSITVMFEEPFWIGLYERVSDGEYSVCKITFGAQPKEYEVYELLLRDWRKLHFSPPQAAESAPERRLNPKRMQRQIRASLENTGIGTKAQQALSRQREENKIERKRRSRELTDAENERKYALRRAKKKAKHRGK